MKIDWKDPAKALTKLYPREKGEEDDDEPAESGSFFNYFEHEDDPFDVSFFAEFLYTCSRISSLFRLV